MSLARPYGRRRDRVGVGSRSRTWSVTRFGPFVGEGDESLKFFTFLRITLPNKLFRYILHKNIAQVYNIARRASSIRDKIIFDHSVVYFSVCIVTK